MRSRLLAVLGIAALALAGLLFGSRDAGRADTPVDLALVLAVDCSWSVDAFEYRLQMQGLARAFRDPDIQEAIGKGPGGRIAIILIQWSGRDQQRVAIPWTEIGTAPEAERLADRISTTPRLTADGATSIRAAIDASIVALLQSPYRNVRWTIDISADGTNNNGGRPDESRDRAVAAGITINGLTILNEVPYLDVYFQNHVIGGPNAFVIKANDYGAYGEAIRMKLLKEIERPVA